jgi:plasmid stabilization system protein ParE
MAPARRLRIVWSPLAIERVESIALAIASDRPAAADRWVRSIFARAKQLSAYPASGRIVAEFARPELRQLPHPPYRLIYLLETSRVVILTVRHGREELDPTEIVDRDKPSRQADV